MSESTRTVGFATCDDSLTAVVERVNAELARLAAAGIPVEPAHVRFGASVGEWQTKFLGTISYRLPRGEVAP